MDIYSSAENLFLKRFPNLRILRNESMRNHTSFKIGGVAPFFTVPGKQRGIYSCLSLFCR